MPSFLPLIGCVLLRVPNIEEIGAERRTRAEFPKTSKPSPTSLAIGDNSRGYSSGPRLLNLSVERGFRGSGDLNPYRCGPEEIVVGHKVIFFSSRNVPAVQG